MNFLPSNPFLENSYNPKPRRLIRVIDDESFIKLGIPEHIGAFYPDLGFEVSYSTRYFNFCHRLTPFSVKEYLHGRLCTSGRVYSQYVELMTK